MDEKKEINKLKKQVAKQRECIKEKDKRITAIEERWDNFLGCLGFICVIAFLIGIGGIIALANLNMIDEDDFQTVHQEDYTWIDSDGFEHEDTYTRTQYHLEKFASCVIILLVQILAYLFFVVKVLERFFEEDA